MSGLIRGLRTYLKTFRPESYGAVGDNTTEDKDAFARMATAVRAAGGGVIVISKPHKVWTVAPGGGAVLCNLTGTYGVLVVWEGQGAINAVHPTAADAQTAILFQVDNVQGIKFARPRVTAPTTVPTSSGVVLVGVSVSGNAVPQSNSVKLEQVDMTGGLAGLIVYRSTLPNTRATGFDVTGNFNGTFYPANFQGNGDDFRGDIVTRGCGRSYFPYNVSGHKMRVDSDNGTAFDDIDITCYTDPQFRLETSGIEVWYRNYGSASRGNALALNFVQADATSRAGMMKGIRVHYDMNVSSYTGCYGAINKYLQGTPGSPGGADNTARGHNLFDVKLDGVIMGDTTQNALQLWTQANWTGEFCWDIELGFKELTAGAGSNVAIDGRGLTTAGPLAFENSYIGIPRSMTNLPAGVLFERNSSVNGARVDGLTGTWDVSFPAQGIKRFKSHTAQAVATGGSGTPFTLPQADAQGANPRVLVTPLTQCKFNLNPISASQFGIVHDQAGTVNFIIEAEIGV